MTIYGTYSQTHHSNNAILASVWQNNTVGDQMFGDSTRYKGAQGLVDASKNPKYMDKENDELRAFNFIFVVSIAYRHLYLKINVCLIDSRLRFLKIKPQFYLPTIIFM